MGSVRYYREGVSKSSSFFIKENLFDKGMFEPSKAWGKGPWECQEITSGRVANIGRA